MKYNILILIPIILLQFSGFTQDPDATIDDIAGIIKTGDSRKLAGYFSSVVDLEIKDTDGSFNNTQAEIIMRDFFNYNKVKEFTVNHKGSSNEGSHYMIGSYKTSTQVFRVYILLKKSKENLLIHKIQFEED
ncbi:MAG: DUF4783 domain-containing protein [Bacteroidales bacterium]|nr:DUF4783 domain-containing protein [Bacteroidales bacterium]